MTRERKQQLILYFTLFQVMLGFGIIIPILPHFALELGASSLDMGLMVTFWAGAQFLFAPVWGVLSDRVGRRPVLVVGLTGYAITFGLFALANHVYTVMLIRLLGGVLAAATIPVAQAYVADTSSGQERSGRMATMGAAMNLGFMTGPALGGLLAGLGFRGTFLIAGALAGLNVVAAYLTLPEPAHRQKAAIRKTVSGLQAVGTALRGPEALHFLLAFAATYGGSTMFSMLGFFIYGRLQAGPGLLAIALTTESIAAAGIQFFVVGALARRLGEERAIGLALLFGILGFGFLIATSTFAHVVAGAVFVAVAIAIVRPLVAAMVSQRTRLEQGMTMGIQMSFDALGRTIGPLIAGSLFLWRDWAPFATAIAMYALFFVLTQLAWRKPAPAEGLAGRRPSSAPQV